MVGSLGGQNRARGPRFRVSRDTSSSNHNQNPLDNEILTGPKTRLPVGEREQGQTGNGPPKDDLRKDSRKQHAKRQHYAERQHLMRILHKQNPQNLAPQSPKTIPQNFLNSDVRKLTEQSKKSPSQQKSEPAGTVRSVMVSGNDFGNQDGAAPTAPPQRTPAAPVPTPPAAPAQPPNRTIPPTPQIPLKIQMVDRSQKPQQEITDWTTTEHQYRNNVGDYIFSVEGEISIVFTDGGPQDNIPIIYQKESVIEYAKKPEDLIEDVFQRSPILRNNNKNFDGESKDDNVMEAPKFDEKMKATIQNAIKYEDKFKETLKRKGVSDDKIKAVTSKKNIENIKLLTSQEKLVVLFAAIEVLHQTEDIEPPDILLLQEIKVVLEAFKTIDNEDVSAAIMTKLEEGIYSNENAEKNNAFEDFINHALLLHRDKIESLKEVHIGRLKVSKITCKLGSFAGASGIVGGIISPHIGVGGSANTLISSPEVVSSDPLRANEQEDLTKKLQEHLTKLKKEFNYHYNSLSVGYPILSVRDEFRKIVEEFRILTVNQLMGTQKNKLYELITELYNWKIKSCDESDIAGNLNKLHVPIRSANSIPMEKKALGKLINDLHETAEKLKSAE